MKKIRKGDDVIVIAGKDKKKIGKVLSVLSDDRVIVAGINQVKKHVKPNPSKNETGGIISKTMPVHVSNVAIYNSETKRADRIGFRDEDGKKVRFLKSNGKLVD